MGGVLRGMGPRAAPPAAASLARGLTAIRPSAWRPPLSGEPEQRLVVRLWRREDADRARPAGEVEPGPAVDRGNPGAPALGDQPRSRHVPRRQPALLDEGVEPPIADIRQGERGRAHRARDPDLLADVA